jgi:hypothetical protein
MLNALKTKKVNVTPPAAIVNNASFPTATVDALGFDYCRFTVILGATDIAFTVAKVQESDNSGMTGAVDIPGTRMGTDTNDSGAASTLPSATDDNKIYDFCIDLRGRKRYLDLVLTIGSGATGGFACVFAELFRAEQTPYGASQAGLGQRMIA